MDNLEAIYKDLGQQLANQVPRLKEEINKLLGKEVIK